VNFYAEKLGQLEKEGRLRKLQPLSNRRGCHICFRGREMLNLTSNDYLGFAGDEDLHHRFYATGGDLTFLDAFGLGSASSRLLTGDTDESHLLEESVKNAYGFSGCLIFNSGYHANIGILPALFGKGDLILSDKLNHASIMDGLRLGSATFKRYRHCDNAHLEGLLQRYRGDFKRAVIVTESVFSMDGDVADLRRLTELKEQYDCLLYVDEAHGIGLYGQNGLGIAEEMGVLSRVDLLIGTFGKALSSVGAFLLCSAVIRDYLINSSRSLIFTTALPPLTIRWNHFLFQEMSRCVERRQNLRVLSEKLRCDLRQQGLKTDGTTNIVPVMIGDDETAVRLAREMQARGYLIFPVRPPTVPVNTARFRLSLTADMTWLDLQDLARCIADTFVGGKAAKSLLR